MFEGLKERQAARKAAQAAGQGQPRIKLYLDIVSPFAYIAFHILENHPTFASVQKTYVPIFLSGIIQATSNKPPIQIKNKGEYVNAQRRYLCSQFNVPIRPEVPQGFPFQTLYTQRALVALSTSHPQLLNKAFAELFKAVWEEHLDIQPMENLAAVLQRVMGDEKQVKEVLERAGSAEVKEALTKRTSEAFDSGAFGLPWFVCKNGKGEEKGFWGVDHMGLMSDFLELPRDGVGLKAML